MSDVLPGRGRASTQGSTGSGVTRTHRAADPHG